MLLSIAAPAVAAAAEARLYDDLVFGPDMEIIDEIPMDAPEVDDGADVSAADSLPTEDPEVSLLGEENPFDVTGEYEIYPTPHSVTYAESTVTLPATMQVTYGEGIDQYTKDRAAEAFAQAGVTLSESASTPVALRVSIDPALSTRTSFHTVTVDATGVTVVGVDTDAAFYGLTTVKRILQQVTNKQVKHLTVEDYADVAFRGFIEGYYGNPWTVEDRAALMEFGGEYKMNIYFYAPKDDPKHSSKWRELYTPEELETLIRPLAEAGNRSKCYYGFALHPFWAEGINYSDDTQYEADLNVLKAKFEQVMSVGVRQIAILGDDRGVPGVGVQRSYIRLMTDLTNWVSSAEMQEKYPGLKTSIPFCPNDYMGNGSSQQIKDLVAGLPASVPIIMTGGTIWGQVSHNFLSTYKSNTNGGHTFMWVNWPCSDKSKGSLTMGAHDIVLHNDLTQDDIDTLQGIMLNPMQQSEPSKAAIFQNADYAWNIWNGSDHQERKDNVWNDTFKYVDHDSAIETETSRALRELSKHMIHQNGSVGWHEDYPESFELSPKLTVFQEKLAANTLTAADIATMKTEFQTLYDAAVTYKNKTADQGNVRILGQRTADGYVDAQEQMAPWLDYWEEFAQANLDLLDALTAIKSNDDNSIVLNYLSAQENLAAARAHSFLYMDHYETAIAGGMFIVPFTNALMTHVSEAARSLIDPTVLIERIITNRADTPTGGLDAMRDGDTTTAAIFQTPNSIAVGEYVGVQYNRPIDINSVRFDVGRPGNNDDTFNDSKLQYMDDNGVWQDIPGATFTHSDLTLEATGLDLNTRGVRAIATSARSGTWFAIKEIYINGKSGTGSGEAGPAIGQLTGSVIKTSALEVHAGPLTNLTDNDDSTTVWLKRTTSGADKDSSIVGDYIGLDLGRVVSNVGRVRFVVGNGSNSDKWTNFKLQYSADGSTWTDGGTYTSPNQKDIIEEDLGCVAARYIRFVNTVRVQKWIYFSELSVWADDSAAILYQSDAVKKIVNPAGTLTNDNASLSADNIMLRPGEFVGIALPGLRRVTDIVADYTHVPGLVLKAGPSEAELEEVSPSARAEYGLIRYIRLENESSQTISFVLNELSVKTVVEDYTSRLVSSTAGNLETVGTDLNWLDGDVNTKAKFCSDQVKDSYVLFDLGQTRSIQKLQLVVRDNQMDYPRSAKVQISESESGPWTDVVSFSNTSTTANTSALDAGWTAMSRYPNYVEQAGELEQPQDARYLRLIYTESFSGRWLELNEIIINDMEYISTYSDPTIEAIPSEGSADFTPDKMLDGDLNTSFKPNMDGETSGSLIYRLSDETSIGQINLVQGETSGVKLSVRPTGESSFRDLGTLSGGLSQTVIPEDIADVAEIKLTWGNVTPTFYELITVPRAKVAESGGQASSEAETIPINSYYGTDCTIDFNENWKFNLGDVYGASAKVYNDAAWRTVDLPHDYSVEGEYTTAGEAESGYLIGGVGWYRKSFTVDPAWEGKTVTIDFGGVYMDCEIYLNGTKLGEHHYGYSPFSFVLSNLDYEGENVIAVKTDDAVPSSRWYSGAGIYRNVKLTVSESVHVARYGTKVETTNAGAVTVSTTIQNDGSSAANVTVKQEIFELDGTTFEKKGAAVATDTASAASVTANGTQVVTQNLTVASPKLWSSWDKGTPNLYVLVTTVQQGDTVLDTYETEFGFRTIEFTTDVGFKLNGENVKLKGVCQHHDQGALGAEAWYRALERQVDILKEMGCNSIRVTHNPAADELIEICNRKGILIIDEFFDGWHRAKNSNSHDFARWFSTQIGSDNALVGKKADETWAQLVVETVTNRDKNAPCVIMYSMGNEITEGAGYDSNYATNAANIIRWAQAVDDTRPLTYGQNGSCVNELKTAVADQIHAAGGVIGINYYGSFNPETAHSTYQWKIVSSETASALNSRGIYTNKRNTSNSWATAENANHPDGAGALDRLTSYDKNSVGWGATASNAWWRVIRSDYDAGEYVWTGFDYIGEPTPWNNTGSGQTGTAWPKSSFFGIIDTNGIPKDSYYLYRSMWNDNSHTLHILPTWDESDLMIDSNGKVEVVVYSDAPMVKLYLNNTEVGSATSTTHTTGAGHVYRTFDAGTGAFVTSSGHQSLYATFNVTYSEGTLRAVACDENGTPLNWVTQGRSQVKTTTGASKLVATADRTSIKNDGKDLSYITIDITDASGEIVNGAESEITVSVTGDGVFMGLDNGVQADHTSFLSQTWKAGAGRLVAIVRSTKEAGSFTLTATADGLAPAAVTVQTNGATQSSNDAPVSYELSKTIYVQLNTEPTLESITTVTLGNGSTVSGTIAWDSYDKSLLAQTGEFVVTGVITIPGYTIPVSVGVVVLDDVAALLNYSAAVQVGQIPVLPTSRPAVMADGTVVSAQFPVTWDLPETAEDQARLFRKAGNVIVNGTAEAFGKTYSVTATIRVSAGSVVEGNSVSSAAVRPTVDSISNTDLLKAFDANASTSWTGSGAANVEFDTAQNLYRIVLHYAGAVPSNSSVTITLDSGTLAVRPTVSGNTATYNLGGINSSTNVTLTFAGEVSLSEVELISGTPIFPIGTTAELDDVKINGSSVSADQLASRNIKTTSVNAVINPVSASNVAVTILPENSDSQIVIVTESEDHTQRAVYTVQLDAPPELPATDDSNDYDRTKTTATAPSNYNGTGNEGPASNAVDGNESTYWHSNWGTNSDDNPNDLTNKPEKRYIQLELEEATELIALRYKPRPTVANGIVTKYRVEVSTDGNTFVPVSEGDWAHDTAWKIAMFDRPVTAKYVRLYGVETRGAGGDTPNKFMSAAEIRVVMASGTNLIDLSEAILTVEPNVFEWKNVGIRPGTGTEGATVTVTLRGEVLTLHEDYELAYENNIDPGTAYIYARARNTDKYQGAAAATFTIVKTDAKVTSFRPVTIPVQPGIDPTPSLPATVMAFTDSADGQPMEVPVTWELPDDFDTWYTFPQVKERVLNGTVDPDLLSDPDLKPTVTLKFAYSQSVDGISMVTATGVIPVLPDTVTVQFDDGTSGERTVAKWYVKGDDTKAPLTTASFNTAGLVELEGDIIGIDLVKAVATVRVAAAIASSKDLAENASTKTYQDAGDNLKLTAIENLFPMALAYWSSGNNNAYQAIKGNDAAGSTDLKDRWSDWESGTPHRPTWFGVAFETSTEGVTAAENQVLTLVPHMVNKAEIMFVDENGTGSAVTFPKSYVLEYYTGPVENLTFDARLTYGGNIKGHGRVRDWTNSPLNDASNWAPVTGATYPAVPTANGQKLTVEFDTISTAIIRVKCEPQDGSKWVGIQNLSVYGLTPPSAHGDFSATIKLDGVDVEKAAFTEESAGNYVLTRQVSANSDATAGIPQLAVTATNNAAVSVKQAVRVPGMLEPGGAWAQAVITSEDGAKTETYTVKFTREGAPEGFFIELDENFPANIKLVDASGKPVTGATPNTEITVQVAKGYQAQVWVEITEGDRLGESIDVINNKFTMPAASVHVYGSVVVIPYKITYLLNGGSFVGTPRETYNVEMETFSVNDPTRPGYVFLGWVGGGLTQPTKGLSIAKGSVGDRTYTAVWQINSSIGGGGGNNGGGGVTVPVDNIVVTTKNPDGSTTVTTTTPGGLVSAVTTAPDGTQNAVIQIPQNSGSSVKAVMPTLDVTGGKTPEVTVQNNTGRPLSVTIPTAGGNTVVAVRTNTDGSETVVPYSIVDENGLRLKAEPGDQLLRLVDNKKTFNDVPADHWSAGAVDFVSSRELFNGLGSANTFAPAVAMDRAMMTTVLWRLAEKPNADVVDLFDDVVSGSYYEQAVCWGVATGVIKGTDNGFEPETPISREMLAVMLYRAAGSPTVVDEMPRRFTDGAQVSGWAQEAMIWCIQNDIIKGYPDNTLGSKNTATRAEVATMLQRFVAHQI